MRRANGGGRYYKVVPPYTGDTLEQQNDAMTDELKDKNMLLGMALGPTQPPMQWVPGPLSAGGKCPGHEAVHSPPSSAGVKNAWSYTFTAPIHLCGLVHD